MIKQKQFEMTKLPPIKTGFEVLRGASKVLLEAKPSENVAKVSFVILLVKSFVCIFQINLTTSITL